MNLNQKWKILHTFLERQIWCFSLYKNHKLKVKLWLVGACERTKRTFFCTIYFVQKKFFQHLYFISMYNVLNKLSEYTDFSGSKSITSYIFFLFLKLPKAFSVFLSNTANTENVLIDIEQKCSQCYILIFFPDAKYNFKYLNNVNCCTALF